MGLTGNQVDAAFIVSDGDEHSSCSGAYCAALSRRMVALKSKEIQACENYNRNRYDPELCQYHGTGSEGSLKN